VLGSSDLEASAGSTSSVAVEERSTGSKADWIAQSNFVLVGSFVTHIASPLSAAIAITQNAGCCSVTRRSLRGRLLSPLARRRLNGQQGIMHALNCLGKITGTLITSISMQTTNRMRGVELGITNAPSAGLLGL
jgi:hypothetical protein